MKLPAVPTVKVVLVALVIAGAWLTVRVKVWVALGVTPLAAVIVSVVVPAVPAAGVPRAWRSRCRCPRTSRRVGRSPVSLSAGVGVPVVVTVNVPALPAVNVGAGGAGDRRGLGGGDGQGEVWVALGVTPLAAVIVSGWSRRRWPSCSREWRSRRRCRIERHAAWAESPVSLSVGVGTPVVVTVKLPAVPTVKVVLVALVIAGAWAAATVRVKLWVALGVTPLAAVMVSG